MNKKSELKNATAKINAESKDKLTSTLEKSKQLAKELKVKDTAKRDTQKVTLSVRDADAHKKAHSLYQHRSYMRRATDDESIARHYTQYFNKKLQKYELLTVKLEEQLDLQYMIEAFVARKQTLFKTSEFISNSLSCGSAYGDMHRQAMKRLAQQKVITIRVNTEDNVRAKYIFELNVECEAVKSAISNYTAK